MSTTEVSRIERMAKPKKSEIDHLDETRDAVLTAALPHVVFDGWGAECLRAAIDDSGVDTSLARLAFPRGGIDLALAFHRRGDRQMIAAMQTLDQRQMRYRDRITSAVRTRLDCVAGDKDAVRRGVTLFSTPAHVAEGSALIWQTVDHIWCELGDTSSDVNWYTKRATLSAVYSATVLFWLGDETEDTAETWAFLDRRIENVMQFETFKGKLRKNPLFKSFMNGPGRFLDKIHAPNHIPQTDLPGYISPRNQRT